MRDKEKTKEQLIKELLELRKQVTKLEKSESERNNVEDKQKKTEEQHKISPEFLSDGYLKVDLKGKITDCNSGFLNQTGYSKEDIINIHFTKLPIAQLKDISQYIKMYNLTRRGRFPKSIEYKWIHKDGTTRWCEAYFGVTKKKHRISGLNIITRDTTERKHAEKALQESEEKYRSLVESTKDSIYLVDRDCRYCFLNRAYLSRFNLSADKVVGKKYRDFHSKKASEVFAKGLNQVFRTGKSVMHEYTSQRDEKHFLRTYSPVLGQDGKPFAVNIIAKDIGEIREAGENIRKSAKRYKELVEKAGIAILIDDRKGKIQYCNIILARIFGYSIEEMKKLSIRLIVHPDDIERVLKFHGDRIQGKKAPLRYTFKGIKKDGSVIYIEMNAVTLEEDGKIIGSRADTR